MMSFTCLFSLSWLTTRGPLGSRSTYKLPWPPTLNHYRRVWKGRSVISAKGRQYRSEVVAQLYGSPTMVGDVEVVITMHPPDKRRRDWDNWHKAPLDALVHAGVLEDDSQIKKATVSFGEVRSGGEYVVELSSLDK